MAGSLLAVWHLKGSSTVPYNIFHIKVKSWKSQFNVIPGLYTHYDFVQSKRLITRDSQLYLND